MIKKAINWLDRNICTWTSKDLACKKEETKGNNIIKQYKIV